MQRVAVLLTLFWSLCSPVSAFQYARGASHVVFGDLRFVDMPEKESQIAGLRVLLKSIAGQILRQQAVGVRGRFRFNEVPNGEYILAVEANGRERVQMSLFINEFKSTDLRYDLELTWKETDAGEQTSERAPLRAVYARDPVHQSLYDQAQIELERGELSKPEGTLESMLESDPADFEGWTQLGTVHFQAGQKQKARNNYRKALNLHPDYVPALFNLAKLEMLSQDYRKAVAHLDRVIIFEPELAEAFYFLGEAHLQLKQGSKAVDYFRKAIGLAPVEMADGHLRMAMLYEAAGYLDLAV